MTAELPRSRDLPAAARSEAVGLPRAVGRHRAPALAPHVRAAAALGDRLPGGLGRPDIDTGPDGSERGVTGQHVTVVALLVVALVAAGAWWVLSGRPEQHALAPTVQDPVPTAAATPAPGTDDGTDLATVAPTGAETVATTAEPEGTVVVDVAGRVRRPSLVTLPAGSRVADALKSTGGARPGVDLTTLNLARPLVDGEQLLVGVRPAAAPPAVPAPGSVPSTPTVPGATVPTALVDLNTATMEQLDTLPGVGPVTGQAILDWRTANGSFTSVDELLEVDGIGEVTLADLRDLVTV